MRASPLMVIFSCLLLAACIGPRTELLSVSLDESMQGTGYRHLFLVTVTENREIQRQVEAALAQALQERGVSATAAHQVSGPLQLEDGPALQRQLREKVSESPATGVLVTRLVREGAPMQYVPPFGQDLMVPRPVPTPGSGTAYFDVSGTGGYFTAEKEYRIQTSLYDVEAGREVWRVLTRTRRPEDVETGIRQYVDLVMDRLQRDGMLAP